MKTWAQRIDAAERRGYFTKQDRRDAQSWRNCAVGEKRKEGYQIESREVCFVLFGHVFGGAAPLDGLYTPGVRFCDAVEGKAFGEARQCLAEIDRLAARYPIRRGLTVTHPQPQ